MKKDYTVAAYYFPQWHHDPQHEEILGKSRDWSEWDVLKHAVPRFPGHNQPKVPVWGYEDVAEPFEMELREVLKRLFDVKEPFGQCEDRRVCEWCDYNVLCRR